MDNAGSEMNGTNLDKGTWYQSAVSGLWYQNRRAAGEICAIRVDGVTEYCEPEDDRDEFDRHH